MKKARLFLLRLLLISAAVSVLPVLEGCGKPKPETPPTRIALNTKPEGATVTILGKERGKTPLSLKMRPGTYLVKFALPGYRSCWQKIDLEAGEQKDLVFQLEPETASVLISSVPDSATVEFQGKNLGSTPIVIPDLPHGSYTAEVVRYGFNRQTVSWTIDSSTPQLVKVDLTSNLGTLVVTSHPKNAEVLVDGKVKGRTPLKESVEEGNHTIEIRRNGYIPVRRTISVKSKDTVQVRDVTLEVKPGSIKVVSKPEGARITINGKHYGNTPVSQTNLKPGSYTIVLEKDGYDPVTRTVELPPGEQLELVLNLDSNTGGADVVTQPAGLTLYLDGKMIGVTEKDPNPLNRNVSKIFRIRNLSMGRHRLTIAHKRARPEKKNFHFEVSKGKVTRLSGLSLWIPNATITRLDGTVETGRIIQNLPSKLEFEPSPGVKYTIEKSTVRKIQYLAEKE
ncbi:MAG: PEGA domain-containing protein [Lentisphaeria bacterium]|nr:PEGA domain-containing protein [Lentisphaeria bacterium]